jgi:hypothetical protein
MANQAIALQARAPQQGNFLAPAIQQAGQIANRMAQQQALDRQTAVAQQQIDIAGKKESREAAIAPAQLTKAEADATAAQMDRDSKAASVLKNDLGMVESGNIDAAAAWRARAAQLLPDWAAYLPSAEKIAGNRQTQLMLAGTVEQIINKTIPTPSTVLNFAPGGKAFAITTGGVNAPRADEVTTGSVAGAPPVAPTTMTLPPAAGEQPMAAPRTPTGGMFQPISASGGQPQGADPQAALLASLMQAKQTGQIGVDVVEQLRQLDPRITPDALDAILAQNGIKVAPGGGMRSAVYRPDGNAMAPQQIANRVGTQYVGRDPTQSPMPGSAMVPLGRTGEEARVKRETPAEVFARTQAATLGGVKPSDVIAREAYTSRKAQIRAEKDATFLDEYDKTKAGSQQTLNLIDQMIGDLKVVNDKLVPGKRAPQAGFKDVIGGTFYPGARFIPGTDAAGFDAYMEQMEGTAFLEAFKTLKGGGQITEIEGEKATRAMSRMKRSTSEVEFVKAAREFADILRQGMARADARAESLFRGESGGGGAAVKQTKTKRGITLDEAIKKYGG